MWAEVFYFSKRIINSRKFNWNVTQFSDMLVWEWILLHEQFICAIFIYIAWAMFHCIFHITVVLYIQMPLAHTIRKTPRGTTTLLISFDESFIWQSSGMQDKCHCLKRNTHFPASALNLSFHWRIPFVLNIK